jgi:hypothetical protein
VEDRSRTPADLDRGRDQGTDGERGETGRELCGHVGRTRVRHDTTPAPLAAYKIT